MNATLKMVNLPIEISLNDILLKIILAHVSGPYLLKLFPFLK